LFVQNQNYQKKKTVFNMKQISFHLSLDQLLSLKGLFGSVFGSKIGVTGDGAKGVAVVGFKNGELDSPIESNLAVVCGTKVDVTKGCANSEAIVGSQKVGSGTNVELPDWDENGFVELAGFTARVAN